MTPGVDWDSDNIRHLAQHGVSIEEAEEAVNDDPLELDSYIVDGELRSEDVGQTASGRILKVVTTDRRGLIRVVTAFDAPSLLKNLYLAEMVKRHG